MASYYSKRPFEMQNTSLRFTRIKFNDFFARVCAQIKILRLWMINHPTTLGFSFFFFFFGFSFSSSSKVFAAVVALLPEESSFEFKNFRESVNKARNNFHGQAKVGKGKFSSEFSLKFGSVFAHISSSTNPITLGQVSMERPRPAPRLEQKCCLSGVKVMTSQAGQMPRSFTDSLRRFRCQCVKYLFYVYSLILETYLNGQVIRTFK